MNSVRERLALGLKCLVCSVAAANCLVGAWSLAGRIARPPVARHVAEWRDAARSLPGNGAAMLCGTGGRLSPVERSRLIALTWEKSPHAVKGMSLEQLDSSIRGLAASSYLPKAVERGLETKGFRKAMAHGDVAIWLRDGLPPGNSSGVHLVDPLREAFGAGIVILLMVALHIWMSRGLEHPCRIAVFLSVFVFVALASAALGHALLPPNGLGVYGGKARLWYLSGGIPDGFWTRPECSVLQPSYPLGLTVLTLFAYMFSGGCGDWLVQLIPACAMALLFIELAGRGRNGWGALIALGFVLSPVSVKMAAEFYAEPFAAVCLVSGWRRICRRPGASGWLVAGFAGLFRPEGLVAAILLWLSVRLVQGRCNAGWRHLLAALAVPLAWQTFAATCGASVYDFDLGSLPDAARVLAGLCSVVDAFAVRFWMTGGIWLCAACVCGILFLNRCGRGDGRWTVSMVFGLLASLFSCWIMGCYRGEYFSWMLDTALPRLLWTASVLVVASFCEFPGREGGFIRKLRLTAAQDMC